VKACNGAGPKGTAVSCQSMWPTEQRDEPRDQAKPFDIPKREVWLAFKKMKANQGAAGVDGQSIEDFEV